MSDDQHPLPVTNLMRRIPIEGFLQLDATTQLEQITQLQRLRLDAIEASRQIKTGTKSAARTKAKTSAGRAKAKNDQEKLVALLKTFTPAQLAQLKNNLT